ncbi:MAG: class I adenylate-forming enzyme family protein [Syntrophales bacterium]
MYRTISSLLEKNDRRYTPSGTTVAEIEALAAGIRERFIERDAPPDLPVCLCVGERSHLLAALLASMAGAPPLILPHTIHPQVLREVHAVRPFRLILADTAVEPPEGAAVIRVEACHPDGRLPALVRPPDKAFLSLFTGGSTGKPRIWSKTPANLFGEALHLARTFGVGESDLVLPTVPPQHIYGLLFSVLLPFVASARVVDRTCTFPQEILTALQREGATILVSVPIHYRAMRTGGIRRFSLRLALSSAAPLDGDDAAAFLEQTGLAINEIYGSTETGGMAIRAYGEDHGSWEPFTCLDWKIISDHLCVRSEFVSPDLPRDAEGFFMTADRAAETGETRFILRGRADHVVKIAGKRVDLEEIREKIRRIPGVADAYVTAIPLKQARQTEISALVVSDLPARRLRAAIRSMDESCARPRKIRIVEAIPILPNGKVDRERVDLLLRALPAGEDQEG